jgi:ACS family allantoate permease-like MFS transporter
MPTGVIQTASSYLCNLATVLLAKYSVGSQTRGFVAIFGSIVGMIAAVFLYTLPLTSLYSRLAALYMSYFYLGPYVVALGMNTANTA